MPDLDQLYREIDRRGRQAIAGSRVQVDPYLKELAADRRQGLSLICRLPAHVTRNINLALALLKQVEPDLYYYPSADMHITVLDLIGARTDFDCPPDRLEEYVTCLTRIAQAVPPVDWRLAGLIASPGAILVKGYYSPALLKLRTRLRYELPAMGLALKERYPTISGHVTVARFINQPAQPQILLDHLASNRDLAVGAFTSPKLELVVHDWYNHHSRLVKEIELGADSPA